MSAAQKQLCMKIKLGKTADVEQILDSNPELVMPFDNNGKVSSAFMAAQAKLDIARTDNPTEERIAKAKRLFDVVRTASIIYAVTNYEGEGFNLALHMQENKEKFTNRLLTGQTPIQFAGPRSEFAESVELMNRSSQTNAQAELGILYTQVSNLTDQFAGEVRTVISSPS